MTSPPNTDDTLIHVGWIVPVVPHGVVLENHSIALTGERITARLPRAQAQASEAQNVLELPGHVMLPGWVNCPGPASLIGQVVDVRIVEARQHSLRGEWLQAADAAAARSEACAHA